MGAVWLSRSETIVQEILDLPAGALVDTDAMLTVFSCALPSGSERWFQRGPAIADEKRNGGRFPLSAVS